MENRRALQKWADDTKVAIGKKVIEIGTYIVNGIRDGIMHEWDKLIGHLKDLAAALPEPIRNALGMESPSKVMTATVGMPIVQGASSKVST